MINQTSETTLVQGTVADAAMTVTLTDGAADIDLSSATIPRNYPGCKLTIKDSAGREIVGWIYTNGAGTVQNIVSTKGGSTRNWTYKNGSFDTTDDYTYRIDRVHVAALVHSGSMLAGLGHISTVAGTAFIDPDIGEDWSSFADGMHFLVVQDVTGKTIGGYLKAAGAGETYSDSLITNGDFATGDLTGWTPVVGGGGGSIAYDSGAVKFTQGGTSVWMYLHQQLTHGSGALLAYSFDEVTSNGTTRGLAVSNNGTQAFSGSPDFKRQSYGTGTLTGYGTALGENRYYQLTDGSASTKYSTFDNSVIRQVLTPSATGSTVVSAKNGTTYNWTWTTTGFDPNGALGFKIYKIGY